MLVTFQSAAAPNVVMLRDLAQYLLGLIGQRLDTRGVILHDDLSGAIRRLESAIADEERAELAFESRQSLRGHRMEAGSGLSQRAWPLLAMMRQAYIQNADIIWGL